MGAAGPATDLEEYLWLKVQPGSVRLDARLKFLYGKLTLPVETAVISEPAIALGMVHTPRLDFPQTEFG